MEIYLLQIFEKKEICMQNVFVSHLYGAETWTPGKQIRNTWKVLECGPGEGLIRSVGPIV